MLKNARYNRVGLLKKHVYTALTPLQLCFSAPTSHTQPLTSCCRSNTQDIRSVGSPPITLPPPEMTMETFL